MRKLLLLCFLAFTTQTNAASFSVTSTSDSGAGSLRQAILDANSAGGDDTITFSVTGTILLSTPLPGVTGSLIISGPGADLLSISGNNTNRIFVFDPNTTNTLSGLKIADGYVTNNLNGGAISNSSDLTLTGCVLTNSQTAGGWGGAIFNSGNLKTIDCRFENNRAMGDNAIASGVGGGGAGFGGAIFTRTGSLNSTNCIFVNNKTYGGNGGPYGGGGGNGGGAYGGIGGSTNANLNGGNGAFGGGGGGASGTGGFHDTVGGIGGFGGGGGGGDFGGAGGYGGGKGGDAGYHCALDYPRGGGGGGGAFGGAVFLDSGSGTFWNNTFSNNIATGGTGGGGGGGGAAFGGAIFNFNGSVTGASCVISSNQTIGGIGPNGFYATTCGTVVAGAAGSAIGGGVSQNGGTTLLTNCILSGNKIAGAAGGNYAIYGVPGGNATGGGLFADGGKITIANSVIFSNTVTGGLGGSGSRGASGGGFANAGGIGIISNAVLSLTNCTVSGNQTKGGNGGSSGSGFGSAPGGSSSGGGIYAPMGSLTSVNATIANNSVAGGLGGTLSGVTSPSGVGSGGGIHSTNGPGFLNTILSGNSSSTAGTDGYGNFNSLGNNLISNTNGITGLISSDLKNVGAGIGSLVDNGGPTLTHGLLAGSLAINAANSSGAPSMDQRGVPRPQGSGVDIGAYELITLIILIDGREVLGGTVTKTNSAIVSLATAYSGGTILYTLDGSQPTAGSTLYGGPFTLTSSATIRALAYNANFSESVEAGPVQLLIGSVYTLTVTASGGGTVSITPTNNTPYQSNTVVTLTAFPASGKMFVNWTGDATGSTTNLTVTMNQNKSIQANFTDIPKYSLATSITGSGTISLNPPSGPYVSNTVVTIVATPATGWRFSNWSGDASGTNPTNTVTMSANKSVQASFVQLFSLTASSPGGGYVSLNPPTGPYASNSIVTATAVSSNGWTFLQWLGDATGTNPVIDITMTRNKAVQAIFGTTLSLTPAGSGSILAQPQTAFYPFGSIVRLNAIPLTGSYFALWGNGTSGTNTPINFVITNATPGVSALFSTLNSQFALTVVANGSGQVSVSPKASRYNSGATVTLTAVPDSGQTFDGWSGDASGNQNPLTTVMSQSKIIYANFSHNARLSAQTSAISSDGFQLNLTGDFGASFRIDGSTNLTNWEVLGTVTNSFGTVQFNDPTNGLKRFYRAIQLP